MRANNKTTARAAGVALAASLAVLVAGTVGLQAEDWPQWRGPNRDGVWNETGMLESFPPGGLRVAWRVPVGPGWSSPIVAQGRVYLTDVQLTPPTATERVLCFAETDGHALWTYAYRVDYPAWALTPDGGGPRATPILRDGKVFTLGALGRLLCLDGATGRVVWQRNLANDYEVKEFTGITASPLIEKDLLILYLCGKPAACVVAFDKNSGHEVWRALDDSFTYSSPILVTAGGKRQLILWTQEAVTALRPDTGQTWWREQLRTSGDQAVSTPVFADGRLLVGGLMFALDPDKPAAAVLWPEHAAPAKRILSNTSTALLRGGCVFWARTTGELVCLDAATGKTLWETNTVTDLKNGSSIHLTPNGDSVLLFTNEGNLIRARLNSERYQELSRVHLIDPTYRFNGRNVVWPPPAYANRHILARNDRELLRASLAGASSR